MTQFIICNNDQQQQKHQKKKKIKTYRPYTGKTSLKMKFLCEFEKDSIFIDLPSRILAILP